MRSAPGVIKICDGQPAGAVGVVLPGGLARTRCICRKPCCSRRRSRLARPPWFRPGCPGSGPAVLAARPPGRPPAWPPGRPPGRPVSILQRCCLPRTAAHQPQRHPNPPGRPAALLPARPSDRRPARQCRSCRSAACREQQPTIPGATPAPPGETQGKYPDNNHGRCPDDGHHAQKPGTPPSIRKPTHQPGNTATMRDTRPGETAGRHPPHDRPHGDRLARRNTDNPPSRTGQDLQSEGSLVVDGLTSRAYGLVRASEPNCGGSGMTTAARAAVAIRPNQVPLRWSVVALQERQLGAGACGKRPSAASRCLRQAAACGKQPPAASSRLRQVAARGKQASAASSRLRQAGIRGK